MFSVITITYNRKQLLEKAVRSVLGQDFSDVEHIIVDDGSTDGTAEMIKDLNDTRVRYFPVAHLGQLSQLRNIGLKHSRGAFIAFLDSDDTFEPGYLQQLHSMYSGSDTQSIICNARVWSDISSDFLYKENNVFQYKTDLLLQRLNDEFVIYPSCFSFRNNAPLRLFDENLKYGDNNLFIHHLATGKAAVLMQPMVNITKHDNNMSGNIPDIMQSYTEVLNVIQELEKNKKISQAFSRRISSYYLYKSGNSLWQIQEVQKAKQKYLAAFLMYPMQVKALAKFFRALLSSTGKLS